MFTELGQIKSLLSPRGECAGSHFGPVVPQCTYRKRSGGNEDTPGSSLSRTQPACDATKACDNQLRHDRPLREAGEQKPHHLLLCDLSSLALTARHRSRSAGYTNHAVSTSGIWSTVPDLPSIARLRPIASGKEISSIEYLRYPIWGFCSSWQRVAYL